jgi:hypothetical protein
MKAADSLMAFIEQRPLATEVHFAHLHYCGNNVIGFLAAVCPNVHTVCIRGCGLVTSFVARNLGACRSLKKVIVCQYLAEIRVAAHVELVLLPAEHLR